MEQEHRNSKYLTGDWDTSDQSPRDHLVSLPALELTQALYSAVTRSEDDDMSASEALQKLQHRVLIACARFECATGGIV